MYNLIIVVYKLWESDPFSYSGRHSVPHAVLSLSVNPSFPRPVPRGPDAHRMYSSSLEYLITSLKNGLSKLKNATELVLPLKIWQYFTLTFKLYTNVKLVL